MNDDLRPEYDLAQLRVRRLGPERLRFGKVVQLAPDVEKVFHSSEAVNAALRFLILVAHQKQEQGQYRDSSAPVIPSIQNPIPQKCNWQST